jgi:chloramphenicol 3-O phosphotransferase
VATSSNGAAAWPIMRTCVVTTDLTVRPPGHVIVLNGASSSGKSTLARRLQDTLSVPFLLLSGDQLVEACVLPARRDTAGPFAWVQEMRPRFFDGFHRCIPAMAAAGNEIDRREAARGNRTPGEGRAHIEQNRIHDHGAYTLPIDTTHGVTDDLVQTVIDEWSGTRRSRG